MYTQFDQAFITEDCPLRAFKLTHVHSIIWTLYLLNYSAPIRRRKCPPGGDGLVKAAVEASLTELKINLPQLFVSNRALKVCYRFKP